VTDHAEKVTRTYTRSRKGILSTGMVAELGKEQEEIAWRCGSKGKGREGRS
jgi:hypothetical protein